MAENGTAVQNGNGKNGNGIPPGGMKILGAVAVICAVGLVLIGGFSIYLQTLTAIVDGREVLMPREAGASVGAVRENLMAVLMAIVGALVMKARASS